MESSDAARIVCGSGLTSEVQNYSVAFGGPNARLCLSCDHSCCALRTQSPKVAASSGPYFSAFNAPCDRGSPRSSGQHNQGQRWRVGRTLSIQARGRS
jgi:hypothetical protein